MSCQLVPDITERQKAVRFLAESYAFPLQVDQLYTPYDLSIDAWRKREKVKYAAQREAQDPFDLIGVDPFWEYKVLLPVAQLKLILRRIINCCRIL